MWLWFNTYISFKLQAYWHIFQVNLTSPVLGSSFVSNERNPTEDFNKSPISNSAVFLFLMTSSRELFKFVLTTSYPIFTLHIAVSRFNTTDHYYNIREWCRASQSAKQSTCLTHSFIGFCNIHPIISMFNNSWRLRKQSSSLWNVSRLRTNNHVETTCKSIHHTRIADTSFLMKWRSYWISNNTILLPHTYGKLSPP